MVVAQKVKEAEITEQDPLLLTRNLLRIAISNISYIRGLFPEKYFINNKSVPALEMKIKKLMPMDAESLRLIDWMEKGVYDALQKKYLKTLLFCVCETVERPMIEEYTFSFNYSNSESQQVSLSISRSGKKKEGGTFKCNSTAEITPNQMRSSACKIVRTLVQLMRTLDMMPEERTVLMKLLYYDDVTPAEYEPPFFRCCSEEQARNQWNKNPLKMEVGNVNGKHLVPALKVKSILDPYEDENDDYSLDSFDNQVNKSQEDQYIVAPVDKQQPKEDTSMVDEDDTQDSVEDEQQLSRIKDWISSSHLDTVEHTDDFPDISVVLAEGKLKNASRAAEFMDKLVKEGVLSKTEGDTYAVNRLKKSDYEFTMVKEETDGRIVPVADKTPKVNDHLYMKALYRALPMQYVTVAKLQNKLGGEANQTTTRKFLHKMAREGFLEAKGNRRLGKRVIHSDATEKKLAEVKKALIIYTMEVDNVEPNNKSNHRDYHVLEAENNHRDTSTCGALHSIGSDLTRMRLRSNGPQYSPMRSEQTNSKTNHANTPTNRAQANLKLYQLRELEGTCFGIGKGAKPSIEVPIISKPARGMRWAIEEEEEEEEEDEEEDEEEEEEEEEEDGEEEEEDEEVESDDEDEPRILFVYRVPADKATPDDELDSAGHVDFRDIDTEGQFQNQVLTLLHEGGAVPEYRILYLTELFERISLESMEWSEFKEEASYAYGYGEPPLDVFQAFGDEQGILLGWSGVRLGAAEENTSTLHDLVTEYFMKNCWCEPGVGHYLGIDSYRFVYYTNLMHDRGRRELSLDIGWDYFRHLVRGVSVIKENVDEDWFEKNFGWREGEEMYIDWRPQLKDDGLKIVPMYRVTEGELWFRMPYVILELVDLEHSDDAMEAINKNIEQNIHLYYYVDWEGATLGGEEIMEGAALGGEDFFPGHPALVDALFIRCRTIMNDGTEKDLGDLPDQVHMPWQVFLRNLRFILVFDRDPGRLDLSAEERAGLQ